MASTPTTDSSSSIITKEMSEVSLTTTTAPVPDKKFTKRDALRTNERLVQARWEELRAFESNPVEGKEKFIVTFPFPYSNGNLHIGHAFSLTKAVFRAQFERHRGKNVLFPFAFHCTGMPIQAAANKLKTELAQFGCPPAFPEEDPAVLAEMEAALQRASDAKAMQNVDKKAKGGKTKLVSKTGKGIVRQWKILKMMVDEEEIPKFVDPTYWLKYFPPIGVDHMKNFGSGVDWRRAFITTSVNKYYDAFIRWQFNTLRKREKILFGKRNNVFSLVDGQVCADHDRSEGEGVGPQEYTLIKLKVILNADNKTQDRHNKMLALITSNPTNAPVYLVPATLRPETMYGQTNCFILPTGEYGAYYMDTTDEIFIMSHRAARGMSCQVRNINEKPPVSYTQEFGKIAKLETFSGDELLGLPLSAPNAVYDVVYTLPLLTISMGKGTGVVTSVPSDAPDDYVALKVLKEKPDFAAKYDITPDMVEPFEVVPIISIEGYGNASAVFMCDKLKIKSFNDKAKLAQAKEETYLKGFTIGVMEVGPYKGQKVCDVKLTIRQEMMDKGQALTYFEPESRVTSRTNDECIVAATDQWYLIYGDEEWSDKVRKHITDPAKFNAYDPKALGKYEYTVGWLREWACTRQFGLGTNLPWDKEWVIESLSDSTIYMAYYTIAHVLQGENNLNGDPGEVNANDLTDEVFDYIFLHKDDDGPPPSSLQGCPIPQDTLDRMRTSFRYYYPMDLRVSAKDLIPNHLTMALYNHAAIWEDEPDMMPQGYYTNGHVMVDAKKMSKSEGNFLMMDETVEEYSADATRFACADAGDSMDDANFEKNTATKAIMSLCNEELWIKEALCSDDSSSEGVTESAVASRTDQVNFMDRVLDNEVNRLVKLTEECYAAMQFREGLLRGWYEMLRARNEYRTWCEDSKIAMHKDKLQRWAEALIILICPVCPHWSEKMWQIIGKDGLAVLAPWPVTQDENKLLTRESGFLRESLKTFRVTIDKASKKKAAPKKATILVTDSYPEWKNTALLWMHSQYNDEAFAPTFMKDLKVWTAANTKDKRMIKLTMQFVSWMKREVEDVGAMAMDIKMPYDQKDILMGSHRYLLSQLRMEAIDVINLDTAEDISMIPTKMKDNVNPGKPSLCMI